MPIVIGYDNPALVATLGAQAARYKAGQQSFENNLQAQANDRANFGLYNDQLQSQQPRQQQQQQPDAAAIGTQQVGGVQILPNGTAGNAGWTDPATGELHDYAPAGPGARIYTPPGDNSGGGGGGYYNARTPFAGGGGAGGQFPGIIPGGGYLSPLQQQQHQQIDQMLQAGYLQPDEAARWKMMVTAGKDPFSQQTIAEQAKVRQIGHDPQLDQLREQQMTLREQALKDAQGRSDQHSDQNAYERQRNALKDAIEAKQKQLASVPITDTTGTAAKLTSDLHDLTDQLLNLPSNFGKSGSATPTKPGNVNPGATPAPGPKAGGSVSITQKKPLTPDVLDDFAKQTGGDVNAMRQLAIAQGYAVPPQ